MKKGLIILLCFATALFMTQTASAQDASPTNKGNWEVSPASAFNLDFGKGGTASFDLGLGAHYFVVNNLGVGANVGFDWVKDWTWLFEFGPSVQYYVLGKVRVGSGINLLIPKEGDLQAAIPVSVGYPIFIKPNVAIEPNVNFNLGLTDAIQGWSSNFGLNFDFYFGDN